MLIGLFVLYNILLRLPFIQKITNKRYISLSSDINTFFSSYNFLKYIKGVNNN